MKHIGWRPPWVKRNKPAEKTTGEWYLGDNADCPDFVGHGRVPALWWTKNLAYNKAYEIHRLNASSEFAKEAVSGGADVRGSERFEFARCSPDILLQMSALRTELDMRIVMPAIVPHTAEEPCLTTARSEFTASSHPHYHGFLYAAGNPQIHKIEDDKPPAVEVTLTDEEESEAEDGAPAEESERGVAGDGDALMCGVCGESTEGADASANVHGAPKKRAKRKSSRLLKVQRSTASVPDAPNARDAENAEKTEKRSDKEDQFWEYFKNLVYEWNPCFDDNGRFRYVWDEEVGAHDVHVVGDGAANAQPAEPERTRLREVLDEVFGAAAVGQPLNLEPLRKLVGRLVQSSGRHMEHGKEGPKVTDACAQGAGKCPVCRCGFPHQCFCRDGERKTHLEKGEKKGSWFLRFPRNDPYCNSYEPHFLLANLGNVDWRPCINLYAVVEYVTKYAMKAPKGSRRLGEVLKSAVDEVCKYGKEGEGVDLLQQSLKKVFTRTLGDRDFSLFEAVHLGLGLPQVFDLLPVVSLNTYGTRRLKSRSALEKLGDDEDVREDSKVDKFNKRLALVRKQNIGNKRVDVTEAELRDLSFYEFYWKYFMKQNKIYRSTRPVALMVTPCMSADTANVTHARHEMYARTCVVAHWRLMSTDARRRLHSKAADDERYTRADDRCLGQTLFAPPWLGSDGKFHVGRYLGIGDLIDAFEGKWADALMEMLVDPVLSEWVPIYVIEQYDRWNPYFRECLGKGLARGGDAAEEARRQRLKEQLEKSGFSAEESRRQAGELKCLSRIRTNAKLLAYVKREMVKMHEKALLEEKRRVAAEGCADDGEGDGGVTSEGESSHPDEDPEVAAAKALDLEDAGDAVPLRRDDLPSFERDGGHLDNGGEGDWSGLSIEQRVSAAGPALAAEDVVMGAKAGVPTDAAGGVSADIAGVVNPQGFDWYAHNVVSLERAAEWEKLWEKWRNSAVDEGDDAPDRVELDVWQRFLFDIMEKKADEWDECLRTGRRSVYKPGRVLGAGSAGTGKSRTTRAIVKRRRQRARAAGKGEYETTNTCVLAAPTGCASFQMKFGAATAHRVYGIPSRRSFTRLRERVAFSTTDCVSDLL